MAPPWALAHGIAFDLYPVDVVEQALAYGIGQGGVAGIGVPVTSGTLAGVESGYGLFAVHWSHRRRDGLRPAVNVDRRGEVHARLFRLPQGKGDLPIHAPPFAREEPSSRFVSLHRAGANMCCSILERKANSFTQHC